jgi:hypothetical protein
MLSAFIPSQTSRDALIVRAGMFPLVGPLTEASAWDGIALAVYATRERLLLPRRWSRRLDKCSPPIKAAAGPAAFKMVAFTALAAFHLNEVRIFLDEGYRRTDAEMIKAFEDLLRERPRYRRRRRA